MRVKQTGGIKMKRLNKVQEIDLTIMERCIDKPYFFLRLFITS